MLVISPSPQVVLPPGRPDYGRQVAKLELPPANVFGRRPSARAISPWKMVDLMGFN